MLRFVSILALMAVAPVAIGAGVPMQINHQGVVTVDGLRFTGHGFFKFAIVDPAGNFVWTNNVKIPNTNTEPSAAVEVEVTKGVYSVALGDMNLTNMTDIRASLFADFDSLKLRIWFDDTVNGSQELSPDQPLTTSPYAFRAAKADTADFADEATQATHADTADFADEATQATHADTADFADAATEATHATTADFADAVPAGAGAIPGEIRMWGGPAQTIPTGWLICDGNPVSRDANAALFAAIGESWGEGDNVNTFNLPDLRGRFVRGVDNGSGTDPDAGSRAAPTVGGNTGDAVGSVQQDATRRPNNAFLTTVVGSHGHSFITDYSTHNHKTGPYNRILAHDGLFTLRNFDNTDASGSEPNLGFSGAMPNRSHRHSGTTSGTGNHAHSILGGGDLETRPANAYVYFIIKQ